MTSLVRSLAAGACAAALTASAWAQTPSEELDNSWDSVCLGAVPGTDFGDRCEEILNAGPGSGARRNSAATGNNLGTLGAQGRVSSEEAASTASWDLGKVSLFFTSGAGWDERAATEFENGYESDVLTFFAGVDFRPSPRSVLGFGIDYTDIDTDYDANAGELQTEMFNFTVFLSGYAGENTYLGGYAGIGQGDYDSVRNVDYDLVLNAGTPNEQTITIQGTAMGATESDQVMAGFRVHHDALQGKHNFGPQVRADFIETDIDGYAETDDAGLALSYGDQTIRSFTVAGGGLWSASFSRGWGVLSPQFLAEVVYELEDDARTIASSFVGDTNGEILDINTEKPDRDWARFHLGLSFVMNNGVVAFVDYLGRYGHEFLDEHRFSAGFRIEF